MSKYILDTGIVLGYIRGASYAEYVENKYKIYDSVNLALMSIVTVGELYSLSMQLGWGAQKRILLQKVLKNIPTVNIGFQQILEKYGEIDAFSQGKHPLKKLPDHMSSRNMGKNDLWIAATASALNASLLTTDRDFDHLESDFLEVIYIDPHSNN